MTFELVIWPEAELDLIEDYDWYEERLKGLGVELIQKVDERLASIQENPHKYQKVHKQIRRVLTHRFPYSIYYLINQDKIFVIAIMHTASNPRKWKRRIKTGF